MDVLKIVLGFALTTVVGGFLGYCFQTRNWRQQNKTRQLETERCTATQVFEEISRLMDKRLYRMRLLFWRCKNSATTEDQLEIHMERYRDLLYEWNDNLNRNLALAQAYFGKSIRSDLELNVYKAFKNVGRELELCYLAYRSGSLDAKCVTRLEKKIWDIGVQVYNVNLRMIRHIQENRVGTFNPDALILEKRPSQVLSESVTQ